MFRIKICGVRYAHDVVAVSESDADAIGLNFFPRSVRFVDPEDQETFQLAELAGSLGLTRVGIFVNATADEIAAIASRLGLEQVQLHGDESVELAERLVGEGLSVIRAIKLPSTRLDVESIDSRVSPWLQTGCAVLLDADGGSAHGGSGRSLDWQSLGDWSRRNRSLSWVLAGGLSIENVSEAVRVTEARAVDVASGVEQPRGTKSQRMIHLFAERAAEALGRST